MHVEGVMEMRGSVVMKEQTSRVDWEKKESVVLFSDDSDAYGNEQKLQKQKQEFHRM